MCIIAIKPIGVSLPDSATIETMWSENPDGAGIMYARDGVVHIEKGFMKLKNLKTRLHRLEKELKAHDTTVVLHFRIGTAGSKSPANTHPFPVSASLDDLTRVVSSCDVAVAHNGIISIPIRRKDISDTMEYVLGQLSLLREIAPDFCELPAAMQLIENQTKYSKLAFLTGDGRYFTTGAFIEDNGILYSNYGFTEAWSYFNAKKWSGYAKYEDEVDGNTSLQTKYLMFLNAENEYILDDSGDMCSAEDYMLGRDGTLYLYDDDLDCAFPVHDAHIVPMWSKVTKWNRLDAYAMEVAESGGKVS